jgi:Calx-beta domain/FG-GAP-like repeat
VSVGDFNTDGKLDLAVVSNVHVDDGYGYYGGHYYHDESRASVLLGNGTGSFADPIAPSVGYGYFLVSAAAGDFNTDGKLDLAVASNGGAVILLPGTGAGTFGIPTNFYTGYYSQSVAAGDVNADGKLDLVTANPQGNNVSVLLGTGTGSFGAAQNYTAGSQPQTDWGCESVTMADFNGDGRLDLVTANGDTGTVSVLLGTGAGTFQPPVSATADSWPYGVVAGDCNGDGRPDVASANNGPNNVSVLLNDGIWPPLPPPSVSVNDVTVTEGNTGTVNATFTVTLLYASHVDVTLHYDTANITAMAGSDYAAASGDVIIAAGQTTKTFTVAVISDRSTEPTETFAVNLSGATNATIADGQGVGTILDNEPRISVSDVTKKEGNGRKTTLFVFTVTLSAAYDQPVTMSYQTVNGTATTGVNDYVAKTGTLTFAPGETTKTVTIEVKGDSKNEANETFYLDLYGNSSNSLFTKNRGIGTIPNDD